MRTITLCEMRISTLITFISELKNSTYMEENEKADMDALIEKIKTYLNKSYFFSDDLIRELPFIAPNSTRVAPETNKIGAKFTIKLQPFRSDTGELNLSFENLMGFKNNDLKNNSIMDIFLEIKTEFEKNKNIGFNGYFKLFDIFLSFIYVDIISYRSEISVALTKHETTQAHSEILKNLSEKIENSSGKLSTMADIVREQIKDRPYSLYFFEISTGPEVGYGDTYAFLSALVGIIEEGRPANIFKLGSALFSV